MTGDFHDIHREYARLKRLAGLIPDNRQRHREYYKKNKAKIAAQRAQHYRDNKPLYRARARRDALACRYGLTEAEYHNMQQGCGFACEIRRKIPDSRKLHVDHNHVTKKVRGLLCNSCNLGLGLFLDNPTLLGKAGLYLQKRGYRNELKGEIS